LYADTIVLPDPFLHSAITFSTTSQSEGVRYLVKHALNVLKYEKLALADSPTPLVAISPFRSSIDQAERDYLIDIMHADGVKFGASLFDKEFKDVDEFDSFLQELPTAQNVLERIRNPNRLLFDTEWKGTPIEQFQRALDSSYQGSPGQLAGGHAGLLLRNHCFGRMGQATDVLLKSQFLGGTPLVQAPTSWTHLNWKLELGAEQDAGDRQPLHVIRALQHLEKTDLEWIGRIPPDALLQIRQSGALSEIRSVLTKGISEIASAKPDAFFRSSDQVLKNIDEAFVAHQIEIAKVREKSLKFYGFDIGTWLVAGSIEVAAACFNVPAFGVAAYATSQIADAPKLRELPGRFRELQDERSRFRRSPMSLFFRLKESAKA
jgi:hypothetical protein